LLLAAAALVGCASVPSTQEEYVAEARGMNDLDLCYAAYYGRRPASIHPIAYLAVKNKIEEAQAETKRSAQSVLVERGTECDMMGLAKLHEMRIQSAIMAAPAPTAPAPTPHAQPFNNQPDHSRDIMRCGSQGKGVDFVTGACTP